MNPDEPLRVLIVDDDEDDYLLTRELLKDVAGTRYQVDWADSGDAALGIIARERHDAYLFDYRLGPMTGVDLLLELRERGRSIPVILLTGMQDFEIDLEAMEAGAADYLVKGQITPQLLERSLRYAVRHHAAMQALRESERKLAEARAQEAHIGAHIQSAILLGDPPSLGDVASVVPLTIPSQTIDGDFYDFFQYDEQIFDLVLGDVMGKGVPAALLGAAAKSQFLRAVSHLLVSTRGDPPSPSGIVNLVHGVMTPHLQSLGSFITAAFARFDLDAGTMALVDCGHTRTLCCRGADGRVDFLQGDNMPLGFDLGEVYHTTSFPFAVGDLFLFYSDGITEARAPDGTLFGEERLARLFEAQHASAPHAIMAALRAELRAFVGGGALSDDVTALIVHTRTDVHARTRREEQVFKACVDLLPDIRAFTRRVVKETPGLLIDEDRLAALELAVNEAASNIIRHAYHGDPDRAFSLVVEVSPPVVEVRLTHSGESFERTTVPPPSFDGSRLGGFGLFLIENTVDDVAYASHFDGRHEIVLTTYVQRSAGADPK